MSRNGSTERIAELNDALRTEGPDRRWVLSSGLFALRMEAVMSILREVVTFDSFTEGNDPYGEHDCAVFEIEGVKVMWKIDYYDISREGGSPDPSDPEVTERVITVMLASEN